MENVSFDIVSIKDRKLIMGFLSVLEEEGRIRLKSRQYDSDILPGKPMTIEELRNRIEEAERSPRLSFEEAKSRLGL